jgi:hypothetical protein
MEITIEAAAINNLDISSVRETIDRLPQDSTIAEYEQKLKLKIDYPREEGDPRELSEIPEVRLWFLRLDSVYPWLIFLLDWKAGELGLYAAMLVPHQFSRSEGIQYNPEALEIFVMQKIFVLADWLKSRNISSSLRLQGMAQSLGYEIDREFFEGID